MARPELATHPRTDARVHWRPHYLAVVCALLAALAACAPASAPPVAKPPVKDVGPPEAKAEPKRGGSVRYVSFADIKNLNPVFSPDQPSIIVSGQISEGLITADPKTGEPLPSLAESWDISQDGLVYRFKLRQGVKWHDGQPFTSRDVKYTWQAILHPKTETVRKSIYKDVEGAKAYQEGAAAEVSGIQTPDDFTVVARLTEPNCGFLLSGGGMGIVPQHILSRAADLNTADFNTKTPVGTGPYKFKEWNPGQNVTVTRNPEYWGEPPGGPYLNEWIYKVVADQNVQLAELVAGSSEVGDVRASDLPQVQGASQLDVLEWQGLSYTYIGFNLKRPQLQDVSVRRAMAHALNVDSFVAGVLEGRGTRLASHMPPVSWAFNPTLRPLAHDVALANRLLDQAGWTRGPDGIRAKAGQRLSFTIYTNAGNKEREQVATLAQQQWRETGLQVEIHLEDFQALVERISKSLDFDLVVIGWGLGIDPNFEPIWHSRNIPAADKTGFNFVSYSNPEVDRLSDEANRVPGCSQEDRKKILFRMQEILADDQPYIWLYLRNNLAAANKKLAGLQTTPFGSLPWNAHLWSLKD